VDEATLPIYPETHKLCEAHGLNPLGLLASGSLLASVAPQDAPEMIRRLQAADIQATAIGKIRAAPGVILASGSEEQRIEKQLPEFERDEIARLFDNADESGQN
jgi:hydrogenase maturation factor